MSVLIQPLFILVAATLVFCADNAISAAGNRDIARLIFYGIVAILALIYVVTALVPH